MSFPLPQEQEGYPIRKYLFSLLLTFHCQAATNYLDLINSQFAGEIGLISVGAGREFGRYSLGLMYGIVPTEISLGRQLETVTFRQTYRLFDWSRFSFHTGLNIYHVLGLEYETHKYGEAPRRYYPIGSVRGILSFGASFFLDKARRDSFYFETGMNDMWIMNWLSNFGEINPADHLSMGIGFKIKF